MKKTLILGLVALGTALFAGEPFLLKNEKSDDFLKTKNNLFERKKAAKPANIDGETNIAIKMNLTQLTFKNLSFQGEYGFHKKMSVALGVNFLLQREFPGLFYGEDDEYSEYFEVPTWGGWGITPEFRFYPGAKDDSPAPNGFYIGAYFRYASYNVKQVVSYQETPNSQRYSAEAKHTYAGFSGGLMIGRQWIIGKHFSLDWWIIGGGYGKAKYTYGWRAENASLTPQQQADVKEQAQANFDNFSILGLEGEITTTPKSVTMTISGLPMYSVRFMGLCLGYAF